MAIYGLYGLRLESVLAFPQLPAREGSADVVLTVERLRSPRPAAWTRPNWFHVTGEEIWFDWEGVALVRIVSGGSIQVDPCDGVDQAGLRSALLGPVFTVLLAQRGLYPLHASAVAIGERAVAFAAESGNGKSTLALALQRGGHEFLADDVAALDVDAEPVRIHPGFPQLKLEPGLLEHLGEPWEALPRVNPIDEKRARPLSGAFRHASLPLERVYLLEEGPAEITGPLSTHEVFFLAQRHGHRAELLERVVGPCALMDRCSRLATRVPFFRLVRPSSLERLDELVGRVEEHVRS